ncbi:uncharacterized protein LOC115446474 isoform X2 [Manduca sexta]|uniref:Protein kinase domain-containing protein n=1 Tax=Manduca sexta TaxID=7130 RepID=A0A921ZB44_MANSE|nr:uncharacterized protein LOC115446474 isoform X2 [Manduca sexta]KAG6454768.1 hypothetical protein O3G_MSEX008855 [Manduca sexta]
MMDVLWVVLLVAAAGTRVGDGLPVRPTPQNYPHDASGQASEGWSPDGGLYAMVPALALVLTAVGLLFGCTWCYRHKDCKLFTASATHLHEARRAHPPDSGFSEPVNNNISEDNNNGPISLREMQNIANNNAAAYIVSENEERNRISRESVVEFEPLPTGIRVADPLERCVDWFGGEDFPRNTLQYLREIGRGWYGRVVEGEVEDGGTTSTVAVKILNQNASLEDKARFLDENKMYRDVIHENVLQFLAKCLQEDPWILLFELCPLDLQQYLIVNRPKMAILNESGVPLRIMCDVTSALAYLHSRGYMYGNLWCGSVLIRGNADNARAVLGRYGTADPQYDYSAPETRRHPPVYTASSDIWSLGTLVWEVCAWGSTPTRHPPPVPDLPCPYRNHLYQVMQLCWNPNPASRPTSAQVHALINHLYTTHTEASEASQDDGYGSSDFEERWQRLKPNTIPKVDEHIAIVHAPSTSMASHFTGSDQEIDTIQTMQDTLSIDMDTAVSRSSSIMSDKDPLSVQIKSESLTNLHGSLEDVRNIYLTHNEMAVLECHQGNISLEENREKEHDRSDSSVDPWLKDIIAGSQDDVSYYKDVSDVIKNLDNILNSEKTSSSESSHQASPSRDNLVLDCKKDYPMQSSLVKSPGISNFQNILETGFNTNIEDKSVCDDDEADRDTIGTLSHSFERHSDTISQQTLENLTPETPIKDMNDTHTFIETEKNSSIGDNVIPPVHETAELPKDKEIETSDISIPKLKDLCVASLPSISDKVGKSSIDEDVICDSILIERSDISNETKSVGDVEKTRNDTQSSSTVKNDQNEAAVEILPDKVVIPLENSVDRVEADIGDNKFPLNQVNTVDQVFISVTENITPIFLNENISKVADEEVGNNDLIEHVTSSFNEPSLGVNETIIEICETVKTNAERLEKPSNSLIHSDNIQSLEPSVHVNYSETKELVRIFLEHEIALTGKHALKKEIVTEINKNNAAIEYLNKETIPERHKNENSVHPATDQYIHNIESSDILILDNTSESKPPSLIDIEDKYLEVDPNAAYDTKHEEVLESYIEIPPKSIHENVTIKPITVDHTKENNEYLAPCLSETVINIMEEKNSRENSISCDKQINLKNVESLVEEDKDKTVESANRLKQIIPEVAQRKQEISLYTHENFHDNNLLLKNKNTSPSAPSTSNDLIVRKSDIIEVDDKNETTCTLGLIDEQISGEHDDIKFSNDITPEITTDEKLIPASVELPSNLDQSSMDGLTNNFVRSDSDLQKDTLPVLPPDTVQNNDKQSSPCEIEQLDNKDNTTNNTCRSDYVVIELQEHSNDSTVYMDLINSTNSKILSDKTVDDEVRRDFEHFCLDSLPADDVATAKNESTVYLDLPSLETRKETINFLHMERIDTSKELEKVISTSTPLGSDNSADNILESSIKMKEPQMSETKAPDYGLGVTLTKLEQTYVPESMSPFESPTKSHHSDTFDENSSVVLGPFENCTLELFKGVKSAEMVDLPKEELLAFSSNFSEINLETPSPLRDGNFLNEVPDIMHDDLQFDDITSVSEAKLDMLTTQNVVISESKASVSDPQTETNTEESGKSVTEKRVSPLTPPNSPGIFLASTSQQKYLVDIDLNPPAAVVPQPVQTLQDEIDLNQIELQITSKLAMAENENNLNIEYSGPLTVEGLVENEAVDAMPESYLAGNGGSTEDLREGLTLDEECVKALRNELELKLPLAQVAAIEPPCESEWSLELPPPPELVVSYPGALSPIAEETGQQLCAYENDTNWNASIRTDSSESYPEPCNNSTDDATELPTGAHSGPHDTHHSHDSRDHSTYTIQSKEQSPNVTYTVHKDIASSKEITMSADSLNASPYKKPREDDNQSPIDDRTYNKNDDEKESNCERISQVSPFLLSPTTDTSAPDTSDNFDNATGVSTLSKTTLPTDAKLSKPSECLSKATSIDSWCSNDTLYNVEENFDDLDPDLPTDFVPEKEEGNSESTDTLTHNDDEKELSHCSTYIIHDSKSEACETFSPDSITANDNYTYTKIKTEAAGTTTSAVTKSDINDSSKNSQTKDLAYGSLMSGLPSYSNCTTEVGSALDDAWKLPQPELVRRSPMGDQNNITPPKLDDDKEVDSTSPHLTSEPCIKKMESVDISCLQDNLVDSQDKSGSSENQGILIDINDSPNNRYRNYMPSVTSTPLTELDTDTENVEGVPMKLPDIKTETLEYMESLPNFQTFQQSAEVRPQDLSSHIENERTNQETEILLEGDSKTLSRNSNKDSLGVSERTPTYSDFESSAVAKPQDMNAKEKSSQSVESGISSEDFRQFENSVRSRPQDLSSMIDATSLLLKSERISSEMLLEGITNDQTSQSTSRLSDPVRSLDISPPNFTNLIESHTLVNIREPSNTFLINFDIDDEMEQPHSIIITEAPLDVIKDNTFDSHMRAEILDLHTTYDSHVHQSYPKKDVDKFNYKMNGEVPSRERSGDVAESDTAKLQSSIGNDDATQNVESPRASMSNGKLVAVTKRDGKVFGKNEKYATVNFLNETFEELIESNVDDGDVKDTRDAELLDEEQASSELRGVDDEASHHSKASSYKENVEVKANGIVDADSHKMTSVTENFLHNEKKFCQLDALFPLLSDIRFTGPATEIMSTSFTQESPTEPTSPECERDGKPDAAIDIIKEWDSDTDSHSTNSSSGEFIWKDGGGHETSVVPSTHFDHQRSSESQSGGAEDAADADGAGAGGAADGALSDGSGDSGSGSEGDEVEFVPSSWDCRAAPAKSSLRSLEQAPPDNKKRVVFKRQKYHCVYEYPREAADVDAHSPAAYLPDLSTYSDWDPTSVEEAELGYGQLFGAPSPLDLYPLRSGIAFGADYDEDFFISSSARPFESLGVMSTTSQFFPGMHAKMSLLERELPDEMSEEFPPPPSPLPATLAHTPSLDFTTPDSGVEDITPGSTTDDDFKAKKLPSPELAWRPLDSGSSSESVSPSSPGGEALGGLRHTRDKLKLDLPPSPHVPSPRHNRVFNFVLDKPKRRAQDAPAEIPTTPLVMTDETPIVTTSLPLQKECDDLPVPEPTFSTFGKSAQKIEPEQKIILTDDVETEDEVKEESPKVVEAVKGEGTVLDSGDEDSGIESSSKATLERNKSNVS